MLHIICEDFIHVFKKFPYRDFRVTFHFLNGVRGHRQKIFVPVNGFCPLGGEGVSPESVKIVILGTKILIRNVA